MISVRQARGLPVVSLFPHPASFRFHLAMDTLAFGCILPTTGRIRDLHPLETCAARRTEVNAAARQSDRRNIGCLLPKALYLFTELLKIFCHFIRIIVSVRSNQF